jgi:hypothetical protein
MESQMARPHDFHDHEHGPNNVGLHPGKSLIYLISYVIEAWFMFLLSFMYCEMLVLEGEDEHRHEKKSVLKKVKEKVKLHGHGQEEHHEVHVPDAHDLYEEDDDEDEEMVGDPEVHGASGMLMVLLASMSVLINYW